MDNKCHMFYGPRTSTPKISLSEKPLHISTACLNNEEYSSEEYEFMFDSRADETGKVFMGRQQVFMSASRYNDECECFSDEDSEFETEQNQKNVLQSDEMETYKEKTRQMQRLFVRAKMRINQMQSRVKKMNTKTAIQQIVTHDMKTARQGVVYDTEISKPGPKTFVHRGVKHTPL